MLCFGKVHTAPPGNPYNKINDKGYDNKPFGQKDLSELKNINYFNKNEA